MGAGALPIAAVAGAASVGMQVYGMAKDAQAAKKDRALKNEQADEVLNRSALNQEDIRREGDIFKSRQAGAFIRGGIDLSGSALAVLESTEASIARDLYNEKREADFRAEQLRKGANIEYGSRSARRVGQAGATVATALGTAQKLGAFS